jgi:hypothetical protein
MIRETYRVIETLAAKLIQRKQWDGVHPREIKTIQL